MQFRKFLQKLRQFILVILSCSLVVIYAGCGTQNVNQYEAKAITILTWQVNYQNSSGEGKLGRFEEFASVSLENINGEEPNAGVVGPDNQGLWWPKIHQNQV